MVKRLILLLILFFSMSSLAATETVDYNNISMSIASNPGGGGFIIQPTQSLNLTGVVLHPGVNADRLIIEDLIIV